MGIPLIAISCYLVALLAEGVDRNIQGPDTEEVLLVALLAEGVDRNSTNWTLTGPSTVALLAEGVDRNLDARGRHRQEVKSPSSRRAWIEIRCNN